LKIWALLLALLTGGLESAAAADRIEWHTYDSGMSRSKFEKKKVFLYFYAEWCAYCRDMDLKTFKDPAVIVALNRNFIPIRVDSGPGAGRCSPVPGQGPAGFMVSRRQRRRHRPPARVYSRRPVDEDSQRRPGKRRRQLGPGPPAQKIALPV